MIKIVASIELDNGKKKTCSFQSKENRPITLVDTEKVWVFINKALDNGYKPQVNWKITYDQSKTHSIIAGMSSKFLVISQDRGMNLMMNMLSSINNNLNK